MLTPFLALARKDLVLFFHDRRALVMSIAAPIVIASFFGYIFGGGPTEASRIAVLAVDQDGSAISRGVVAGLTADKNLAVKPSTLEAAREAVRHGKATLALVIPKAFGADAGRAFFNAAAPKPKVGVLYDPSHGAETGMVEGILTGHVMDAVSKEMFNGPMGRDTARATLAQLDKLAMPPDEKSSLREVLHGVEGLNAARDAAPASAGEAPRQGLTVPYQVESEAVTSGAGVKYNGYAHSFGGMGVQFILFVGIEVGVGLLMQRQTGVWKRLRAAPLSKGVLLGSRATSAALTSMFVLMVLFAFARVVFGVRIEGSLAGFLGVCAAFSLMTAAWGLLIAAIGKTPEATRGLAIVTTLFLVMLGGAWVPTFVFPTWLQKLTVVIPTRWAMDGLDATTWRGLGFGAAVLPIALLAAFSLACGALAVVRFRWDVDG
jgi:linearmycin/streptolysin S transport system permease protein